MGDFRVLRELGSGSFATVYEGVYEPTPGAPIDALPSPLLVGQHVAIKVIPVTRLDAAIRHALEEEIRVQMSMQHRNIVPLLQVQRSARYIFLVLELCDGGDMAQWVKAHGPLSELDARHVFTQVCAGLQYLSERSLMHRDLKLSNLLLHRRAVADGGDAGSITSWTVRLADFGFARHLDGSQLAETLCGSPLYMAPELLSGAAYNAGADLYSAGVALAEMLTGKVPFTGRNPMDLLRVINHSAWSGETAPPTDIDATYDCGGILPPAIARGTSPSLKLLIWALLRRDPDMRITFDELFVYPWCALAEEVSTEAKESAGAASLPDATSASVSPTSLTHTSTPVEDAATLRRARMSASISRARRVFAAAAADMSAPATERVAVGSAAAAFMPAASIAQGRAAEAAMASDYGYALVDDDAFAAAASDDSVIAHDAAATVRDAAASAMRGYGLLQAAAHVLRASAAPLGFEAALKHAMSRFPSRSSGERKTQEEGDSFAQRAWDVSRASMDRLPVAQIDALVRDAMASASAAATRLLSDAFAAFTRAQVLLEPTAVAGADSGASPPKALVEDLRASRLSQARGSSDVNDANVQHDVETLLRSHRHPKEWSSLVHSQMQRVASLLPPVDSVAMTGVV